MTSTLTSPSGRTLHHRATRTTTPHEDAEAKAVRIKLSKEQRLAENREYLKDANVQAFLKAIADAEGGGYDFKYGAVKGKRNDPWRFTDFSTHPGPGSDGATTAAGMYQINKLTWQDHGEGRMGLTDFTPDTQDLIAVSILRGLGIIDKIKDGDIESGLSAASKPWAALPIGRGQAGRHNQPCVTYEHFEAAYKVAGGTTK
ncbi:paar repeat-containing protein [Duganella vulcania]|uniref:paar repeat-containing protein n=1 Tax=Duganella vulcania TaxID=2692166 RepID=UPI0020C24DB0|nr:paar repeat-containing protein [Duganella vulcania]